MRPLELSTNHPQLAANMPHANTTTRAPASLQNLPNELTLRIIEAVIDIDPPKKILCSPSLYNIALASRHLNTLATPFMYSCLRVTGEEVRVRGIRDKLATRGETKIFLGTIISSPRLGGLVKHVRWRCIFKKTVQDHYYEGNVEDRVRKLTSAHGWLKSLNNYLEGGVQVEDKAIFPYLVTKSQQRLAQIIAATPNIESLRVVDAYGKREYVHWIDSIRFRNPEAFMCLKSVSIRVSVIHKAHLMAIIMLPNMNDLELSGLLDIRSEEPPSTPNGNEQDTAKPSATPSSTSKITILQLKYCGLPTPTVAKLFPLFDHLTQFRHDFLHSQFSSWKDTAPKADTAQLISALSLHAQTLKSLTLYDGIELRNNWDAPLDVRPDLLPTLKHFKYLAHLRLPYTYLFSYREPINLEWVNILPPSIETLTLQFAETGSAHPVDLDQGYFDAGFEALAASKVNGRLPLLARVRIDPSSILVRYVTNAEGESRKGGVDWKRARGVLEGAGVVFEVDASKMLGLSSWERQVDLGEDTLDLSEGSDFDMMEESEEESEEDDEEEYEEVSGSEAEEE